MGKIKFTDKNGSFVIENPENYSGLYLPLAGEMGLKSNITPSMAGDAKTDQNHFYLSLSVLKIYITIKWKKFLVSYRGKRYLVCIRSICFTGS